MAFLLRQRSLRGLSVTWPIPGKRPARARASRSHNAVFAGRRMPDRRPRLVLDVGRKLAAIGPAMFHHLLVQTDIHAGAVIAVARKAEFLREFAWARQAGVDIELLPSQSDGVSRF